MLRYLRAARTRRDMAEALGGGSDAPDQYLAMATAVLSKMAAAHLTRPWSAADPSARGEPATEAGRRLVEDLMSSTAMMGPWQVRDAILAIEREAADRAVCIPASVVAGGVGAPGITEADLTDTFCYLRRHRHPEDSSCKRSRDEAASVVKLIGLRAQRGRA